MAWGIGIMYRLGFRDLHPKIWLRFRDEGRYHAENQSMVQQLTRFGNIPNPGLWFMIYGLWLRVWSVWFMAYGLWLRN
jgi:hypothetical protein